MYISLNSKKSNACPLHIASHDKELSTLKNSAARVYNNLNSKNKKKTLHVGRKNAQLFIRAVRS